MYTLMYTCECGKPNVVKEVRSLRDVKCHACGKAYPKDKVDLLGPILDDLHHDIAFQGYLDKVESLMAGARKRNPLIADC